MDNKQREYLEQLAHDLVRGQLSVLSLDPLSGCKQELSQEEAVVVRERVRDLVRVLVDDALPMLVISYPSLPERIHRICCPYEGDSLV